MSTRNVEVVKFVYDRFARGDAASVLTTFDEDIEFRLAEGHPYQPSGQPWIGKEAVTKNFLMKAGPEWDSWAVVIGDIVATDDAVVVECRYTGTYRPTARTMDVQVCHVWRLRNGKIVSFHQYLDTATVHDVMCATASTV